MGMSYITPSTMPHHFVELSLKQTLREISKLEDLREEALIKGLSTATYEVELLDWRRNLEFIKKHYSELYNKELDKE